MKIGVIGCGCVGFNTLKAFSMKGHECLGYDIDEKIEKRIAEELGEAHIAHCMDDLRNCTLIFACVPTEQLDETGACNVIILQDIVEQVSHLEELRDYKCEVFVQRSTCPPGTAKSMKKLLRRTEYAVNPSFLRKNMQWIDTIKPERISYAGSEYAISLLDKVYEPFECSAIYKSENMEVVELLKYCENVVDAVLISLWNELLMTSDCLGISRDDFTSMIDAFTARPKFASSLRIPSKAFGLWCLPKDVAAFIHMINQYNGLHFVLQGAKETNDFMAAHNGVNELPASDLYEIKNGRIIPTKQARILLHL
ncbi:MAG: hypothetical protein NT002_09145 [candidate division Zixibacteria bacterium]|nr:hypothetical protein [candidate division Zixibacteria bacterium]